MNVNSLNSSGANSTSDCSAMQTLQGKINTVNANLSNILDLIAQIKNDMETLKGELAALDSEPAPIRKEGESEKDFAKRLDAWKAEHNAKREALLGKISAQEGMLAEKLAQLEKTMQQSRDLQAQIPEAQKEDAERLEKARNAASSVRDDAAQSIEADYQENVEDKMAQEIARRDQTIRQQYAPSGSGLPDPDLA